MKFVYVVLVIVIVGGILVWLTNSGTPEPTTQVTPPVTNTETESVDTSAEAEANAINPEVTDTDPVTDQDTSADKGPEEPMADVDVAVESEPEIVVDPVPETRVFTVSGTNFAFDVEEIRVNQGDTVTINFESAEGVHDWVVDEFGAATEVVQPGTPTSVTFVADQAGTFEYYCSVGSHRAQGMVGTLIVE